MSACLPLLQSKLEKEEKKKDWRARMLLSFLPWWGAEDSRRASGSRPTGIACDWIGLGSLALSTLHPRPSALTRLIMYWYF
jgi:hypothetical protein